MAKIQSGDRIAYSAKFLRDTCQHTGNAPKRRGEYLGVYDAMPDQYSRVKWDDMEALIASGQGQYADLEYCEEIRRRGQIVSNTAICKVNSAKFSLT